MNLGLAGTWLAFCVALLAGLAYLGAGTGRERFRVWADWLFRLEAVILVALAAWLWHLLHTHQFQYAYVASYSSTSMATKYVFAAFWGGQQGTFLLWALWGGALGTVLGLSRNRLTATAMFFFNWAQIILLLILVVEGPFKMLARVPADGQGLNPLLQDYWMVIHPPVLFLGFASLLIPYVLALSTLCHRDKGAWLKIAPPWVLFSTVVLGTGFTMGGIWAYKVLGWGGFWGWDPVENTSLVPWLFNAALFHGLLVQRATGALARTNVFLALLPFLFVLFGSFLTRSGVLADFSVHSFVDLGLNAYLLSFLGIFAVFGIGTWLVRSPGLRDPQATIGNVSREFGIWLGMLTFLLMGLLTMLGTSAPLVSKLFGPAGAVQMSYYNVVNGVLGILLLVLVGSTPLMRWRKDRVERVGKYLVAPAFAALVAIGIAAWFGLRGSIPLLLVGGSAFAIAGNLNITLRALRRGPVFASGYISHLGVAILLIGIVVLGQFGKATPMELPLGETRQMFGFDLTYRGMREQPDGRTRAAIDVSGGGREFEALPPMYFSEFNQGMMRHPHVERFLTRDLYISPIEIVSPDANVPGITLAKGASQQVGDLRITFVDFDMEMGATNVRAAAQVDVEQNGETHRVVPAILVNDYGRTLQPAEVPGGGSISIAGIDPENGRVMLTVRPAGLPETPETLVVEVSTKPFINLVWLGMSVLLSGTLLAVFRRTRGPGSVPPAVQ